MSLKMRKVTGTNARRLTSLAIAAGLSVSVAACGSSSHNSANSAKAASKPRALAHTVSTPAPVAKTSAAPAPHVNLVKVTASNSKLVLSSTSFHAGAYTFRETNSGTTKHALSIYGPGLTNKPTGATLAPGQTSDLIVPLTKGSYELWSPVGNDKAQGLVVHITVT